MQLVVIDDVLVGRTGLRERVQLVHVVHVVPQRGECFLEWRSKEWRVPSVSTNECAQIDSPTRPTHRNLKVGEIFARHANVLQPRHQLAIETADRVAGQEARLARRQMLVDLAQMAEQRQVALLLAFQQHQLQLRVDVLDEHGDLFVLDEQVVAAGDVLHDVPFDFVVLENRQTVVDQNRRMGGLEVGAEIRRGFLHVDGGDLRIMQMG